MDHFEKLLEAACPHHPYPVKHKLEDCTMMKKFKTSGDPSSSGKSGRHPEGRSATPILVIPTICIINLCQARSALGSFLENLA
jgi:hypothetical protein